VKIFMKKTLDRGPYSKVYLCKDIFIRAVFHPWQDAKNKVPDLVAQTIGRGGIVVLHPARLFSRLFYIVPCRKK
jgi:hypothetical protein